MIRSLSLGLLTCSLLLVVALPAAAQGNLGESAADFPPVGSFNDGKTYQLTDYAGKIVVLYFFEATNQFGQRAVPERNAVVKAMKDKPVKFLGIAANATSEAANGYVQQTQLAMPVYGDNLGLMQKRYGMEISLQNIYQYRVIGPDGKIIGYQMTVDALEKLLDKTKPQWKIKKSDYDPRLASAVDALEWGQFAQGMKLVAASRRNTSKRLASSAGKLFDLMKKKGEEWKTEAEGYVELQPARAYDVYSRIAAGFAGDELAKSVAAPLKKLKASKAVTAELTARKAFAQIQMAIGQMTPAQKPMAVKFCRNFIKRYEGTPTAEQADVLANQLGN